MGSAYNGGIAGAGGKSWILRDCAAQRHRIQFPTPDPPGGMSPSPANHPHKARCTVK